MHPLPTLFEIPSLGLEIYLDKPRPHGQCGADLARRMSIIYGVDVQYRAPKPAIFGDSQGPLAWDPVKAEATDLIASRNMPFSTMARLLHLRSGKDVGLLPLDLDNFPVSTYDEVSWLWEAQLREEGQELPFPFGLFDTDYFAMTEDEDLAQAVLALAFGFECSPGDEDNFPAYRSIIKAVAELPDVRPQLSCGLLQMFLAFTGDEPAWHKRGAIGFARDVTKRILDSLLNTGRRIWL